VRPSRRCTGHLGFSARGARPSMSVLVPRLDHVASRVGRMHVTPGDAVAVTTPSLLPSHTTTSRVAPGSRGCRCSATKHLAAPPLLLTPLPSVWLWDVWVGLAPTLVLGMAPTHTMFGCQMTETVGANLSPVWMDLLGWDL
jgi:hypothetical protein